MIASIIIGLGHQRKKKCLSGTNAGMGWLENEEAGNDKHCFIMCVDQNLIELLANRPNLNVCLLLTLF